MASLGELEFAWLFNVEAVEQSEVVVHQMEDFKLVLQANSKVVPARVQTRTGEFVLRRAERLAENLLVADVVPDTDSLVFHAASQ